MEVPRYLCEVFKNLTIREVVNHDKTCNVSETVWLSNCLDYKKENTHTQEHAATHSLQLVLGLTAGMPLLFD